MDRRGSAGSPRRNRTRPPRPGAPARGAPGSGGPASPPARAALTAQARTSSRVVNQSEGGRFSPRALPSAGRRSTDQIRLLVARHLAHVEDAVVDAAVRIAHLLGGLLVPRL